MDGREEKEEKKESHGERVKHGCPGLSVRFHFVSEKPLRV